MTQEEIWQQQYNRVMLFMKNNMRRPSKHRIEEHRMLNWMKHNKKLIAKGEMPTKRIRQFNDLLSLAESLTRINQYTPPKALVMKTTPVELSLHFESED